MLLLIELLVHIDKFVIHIASPIYNLWLFNLPILYNYKIGKSIDVLLKIVITFGKTNQEVLL
nr:MAG TPA: hypothetical protein [Bacteriophage sp.]